MAGGTLALVAEIINPTFREHQSQRVYFLHHPDSGLLKSRATGNGDLPSISRIILLGV